MKRLLAEVEAAFQAFSPKWQDQFADATSKLRAYSGVYQESYIRLVSLQAWRTEFLESRISEGALGFFLEAQNDAVLSHVLAAMGCWRPSLQALRSVIENVYRTLYYMDHPVELTLWKAQNHRIDRTELEAYLSSHPQLIGVAADSTGIPLLATQYSVLNQAVHGSSDNFRMTTGASDPLLCFPDRARLGKWAKNESDVVRGVNMLLCSTFREQLKGTSLPNLRKSISLGLSSNLRSRLKTDLAIVFPAP